jgi:hypothetical protein
MTPADQATEKLLTPFSVRRRERGGRSVVQVSNSVSAIDAMRARIRAQSKDVAAHIACDPEAKAFIDDWATPEPIRMVMPTPPASVTGPLD